jgi:carbohydrate kinase (thermoresistant glucokinase family)
LHAARIGDEDVLGATDEQPAFDHADDAPDAFLEPCWIGDLTEPAVEDAIAAVGNERLPCRCLPQLDAGAARLGWPFEEGDTLHPEANVAKMHAGIPLTDADRQPWLEAVAAWVDGQRAAKQPGIITCSALKRSYRQIVVGDRPEARLVYLRGSRDLIAERLSGRSGHFMPPSLLQSQIDTLEEPRPDEDSLTVDIGAPPGEIADEIIRQLRATAAVGQGAGRP